MNNQIKQIKKKKNKKKAFLIIYKRKYYSIKIKSMVINDFFLKYI